MEILIWNKRTEQNISCRQLAKLTGLSKTTINNIENGKTSPTLDELDIIATALNCSIYDLFKA